MYHGPENKSLFNERNLENTYHGKFFIEFFTPNGMDAYIDPKDINITQQLLDFKIALSNIYDNEDKLNILELCNEEEISIKEVHKKVRELSRKRHPDSKKSQATDQDAVQQLNGARDIIIDAIRNDDNYKSELKAQQRKDLIKSKKSEIRQFRESLESINRTPGTMLSEEQKKILQPYKALQEKCELSFVIWEYFQVSDGEREAMQRLLLLNFLSLLSVIVIFLSITFQLELYVGVNVAELVLIPFISLAGVLWTELLMLILFSVMFVLKCIVFPFVMVYDYFMSNQDEVNINVLPSEYKDIYNNSNFFVHKLSKSDSELKADWKRMELFNDVFVHGFDADEVETTLKILKDATSKPRFVEVPS